MSFLSLMEARLPPGFRFHPRDEELVCDYLQKKINGDNNIDGSDYGCPTMINVDLNKCEPWDLPEMACVGGKEWYFFSLRDRKYATGQRTNRATLSGYWKATGKDRTVTRKGVLVGMRKTLVFYRGRAPKGNKTDWVMYEFRIEPAGKPPDLLAKEDWVLCRVSSKRRSAIPKLPPTISTTADSFPDNVGGSSSILSLSDTYMIAFDDHHHSQYQSQMSLENYEQVPCFSDPLADPTAATHHHPQPPQPGLPAADNRPWLMSQLVDGDIKMIRAVLTHLTKLEGSGHKREGMESYLSPEAVLHNIW